MKNNLVRDKLVKKMIRRTSKLRASKIAARARDKNGRAIKDGNILRLRHSTSLSTISKIADPTTRYDYLTCVARILSDKMVLSPDLDGKWDSFHAYRFNNVTHMRDLRAWEIIDPFWGYVDGQ